jgi:uncharacterized protein
MNQQAKSDKPWYADGLRFSCTRCGNCCRGPGYVWVDDEEIALLADHFEMETEAFTKVYTRKVGRSHSLREQANDDCIFFDQEQGCLVYEVRPRQCQTWPFWEHNLETPTDWKAIKPRCPGSGKGQLFSIEEITAKLAYLKR